MKHLLILIILAVVIYFAWNMADKKELAFARKFVTKHGVRLGAIIAILVALLAAAYYIPSTNLL
jgi:hypothetical protein